MLKEARNIEKKELCIMLSMLSTWISLNLDEDMLKFKFQKFCQNLINRNNFEKNYLTKKDSSRQRSRREEKKIAEKYNYEVNR